MRLHTNAKFLACVVLGLRNMTRMTLRFKSCLLIFLNTVVLTLNSQERMDTHGISHDEQPGPSFLVYDLFRRLFAANVWTLCLGQSCELSKSNVPKLLEVEVLGEMA